MTDIQRWDVDGRAVPNDTEGEYIKYDDINKIKAEGIKEMLKQCVYTDEYGCREISIDYIEDYADKLEKGE